MKWQKGTISLSLLVLSFFPNHLWANESDLFGEEQKTITPPEGGSSIISSMGISGVISGSVDFRFVHTGTDESWKYGGPGVTSYGTLPGSLGNPDNSFKVPRVALVADVISHSRLSGHVELTYDDLPDPRQNNVNIGVTEAYGQYHFNDWLKLRGGIAIPPISLEHSSQAWSTLYTLTPSALNSWIGEEIRPIALEADFTLFKNNTSSLHFFIAPFSNNEPAGSILAWRGWAFDDLQYQVGSRLKFQNDIPTVLAPSGWDTSFDEIDGHMGVYGKMSWKINDQWLVEGFYLDNLASGSNEEPSSFGGNWAWATHFAVASVEWNKDGPLTVIGQGLYGNSRIQNAVMNLVSIEYYSYYGLATWRWTEKQRLTFRFDGFRVNDLDSYSDNNFQSGTAETYAYSYSLSEGQTVWLEYLHPNTTRPGNSGGITGNPSDDIFQVGYRFLF